MSVTGGRPSPGGRRVHGLLSLPPCYSLAHMSKQRTRRRPAAALLAVATVFTLLSVTAAGAQAPGDPDLLVTDYEAYPDTEQTSAAPDCAAGDARLDVDGAGYTLNGGPLVATLGELGALATGDVLTASFAVGADCVGSVFSLTLKEADAPFFDPASDQFNVGYVAVVATEGLITIEFTLPPISNTSCDYQLDHVVGYPLAVVGPNGSFYSPALRGGAGRNMLIGAVNGTLTECGQATTTTTGSTTTTTSAPTTTTTAPPSTSTTQPPASTTSVPGSSTSVVVTQNQVQGQGQSTVVASGRASIPQTGPAELTAWLAVLGAALFVTGSTALVVADRRRAR